MKLTHVTDEIKPQS